MKRHKVFFAALIILITGCGSEKEAPDSAAEMNMLLMPEEITEEVTALPSDNTAPAATTVPPPVQTTVATTLLTTITTTVTEAPPAPVLCDELTAFLEQAGYSYKDIERSRQLIAVSSSGQSCVVWLFENNDNAWSRLSEMDGIVGREGVSADSYEGSWQTPKGLFGLGTAFGTEDMDGLSVEYRKITPNSYWVDDPESEYYNQWMETDDIRWNSAEHLIEYPQSYKYALEIRYNQDPVVPYKGSAMFVHCAVGNYTAGCVGVPEDDMRHILEWVDKDMEPIIIIN